MPCAKKLRNFVSSAGAGLYCRGLSKTGNVHKVLPVIFVTIFGLTCGILYTIRLALTRDDVRYGKKMACDFVQMDINKKPPVRKMIVFNQKYITPPGLIDALKKPSPEEQKKIDETLAKRDKKRMQEEIKKEEENAKIQKMLEEKRKTKALAKQKESLEEQKRLDKAEAKEQKKLEEAKTKEKKTLENEAKAKNMTIMEEQKKLDEELAKQKKAAKAKTD